jgi:hypothetical protein
VVILPFCSADVKRPWRGTTLPAQTIYLSARFSPSITAYRQ